MRHTFIQSQVKTKLINIHLHRLFRALRQLHAITSSFDWLTMLSVSLAIGLSDHFGFGFTTPSIEIHSIVWLTSRTSDLFLLFQRVSRNNYEIVNIS